MQKSLKRGLPELQTDSRHRERLVICGGGPSIEGNLSKLRKELKHTVFCVNGALGYLLKKGITPDACVLADPSPILESQVTVKKGVKYYVASCCDESVFEKLKGQDIVLWHSFNDADESKLVDTWVIHGGNTAALRCINIGYLLGYRDFLFFGLDSSFSDKQHAYEGIENKTIIEIETGGRRFFTSPQMAVQARDFNSMFQLLTDCRIRAYGDGLIPHMSKLLNRSKNGHSTESVRGCIPVVSNSRSSEPRQNS
jgi:hypothetical protein